MQTLSNFLNKASNWKTLLLSFGIYMLFNGYFLKNAEEKINELSGNKQGVIDLTFGFNPQKTLAMIDAYSAEARKYYAQTEMTTDVIYPIIYALFFGIILTLLFKYKPYSPHKLINIMPFFSLIFDYLENISIVTMINQYPNHYTWVATACELFKMLKWISFGIVILLIIYGLVRLAFAKIKKEN